MPNNKHQNQELNISSQIPKTPSHIPGPEITVDCCCPFRFPCPLSLFVVSPSQELLPINKSLCLSTKVSAYKKCLNAQISSPTTTPSPPHPNLNVENYAIRRSFKFYKAQIFEMEVLLFTEDSDSEFGSILAGQAGVGWGEWIW